MNVKMMNPAKGWFKVLSIVLTTSFLYMQVAWAAELPSLFYGGVQNTPASTLTPQQLEALGLQNDWIVTQQQMVQENEGSVLTVTTDSGDKIKYKDGSILSIEKSDGIIVEAPILDEEGNLTGGLIHHTDGSQEFYQAGETKYILKPDGSVVSYQDNLPQAVISPDGQIASYAYNKDSSGNILATLLDSSKGQSFYDSNGKLAKVISADGTTSFYESGILKSIRRSDGGEYLFEHVQNTNGIVAVLKQYIDAVGNAFTFKDGAVNSVTLKSNGMTIPYDQFGNLVVSKEEAIDRNKYSTSKYVYSRRYLNAASNPHIMVSFKVPKDVNYSSFSLSSNRSMWPKKYIKLNLVVAKNSPKIDYYRKDYKTNKVDRCYKTLPQRLDYDTEYVAELVWVADGVGIYIYKKGESRPTEAIYKISDKDWSPRFYVQGYNLDFNIDPSSSGEYRSGSQSTRIRDKSLIDKGVSYKSEINFDNSSSWKSFSMYAGGSTNNGYSSMNVNWSKRGLSVSSYKYDKSTRKRTRESKTFSNIVFETGKTYVVEVRMEGGKAKLLIYEKGQRNNDAAYTLSDIEGWRPNLSSSINGGGSLKTSLTSGSSSIDPELLKGIPTDTKPLMEELAQMVGFTQIGYNPAGEINKVLMSDGSVIEYADGLVRQVTDKDDVITRYSYQKSDLGHILRTILEREGVKRVYDANGKLLQLISEDGVTYNYNGEDLGSVENTDGITQFYENGILKGMRDDVGSLYEFSSSGKVSKVISSDGREYAYSYKQAGNLEETLVEDLTSKVTKVYKDGLLVRLIEPSGDTTRYSYDADNHISELTKERNSRLLTYETYSYSDDLVIVKDNLNNETRWHNGSGKLIGFTNSRGEHYDYIYEEDGSSRSTLSWIEDEEGMRSHYDLSGVLTGITLKDGTSISDISFRDDGSFERFTLTGPDFSRPAIYENGSLTIRKDDGTELFFDGEELVYLKESSGKVIRFDSLADDLETQSEYPHKVFSGWKRQYYSDVMGITSARKVGDQIVLDANLIGQDAANSCGEAYIDLRYYPERNPSGIDLEGEYLSLYVKFSEEVFAAKQNEYLSAQLFVKDTSWRSQYGTMTIATESDTWYRLTLTPSQERPLFGEIDKYFNPSRIALLGLRLQAPGISNSTFAGKVFLKADDDMTLVSDEKIISETQLFNLREILSYLDVAASKLQGAEYISHNNVNLLTDPDHDVNEQDLNKLVFNNAPWRAQKYRNTQGISSVSQDPDTGIITMQTQIQAGHSSYHQGEMLLDLRKSAPVISDGGFIDMRGKEIKFLFKAPDGFISDTSKPPLVEVFAKDSAWRTKYGRAVKVEEAGGWYEVTLNIEEARRGQWSFDPSQIAMIGLRVRATWGSDLSYNGPLQAKCLVDYGTFVNTDTDSTTPIWTDVSAIIASGKRLHLNSEIEKSISQITTMPVQRELANDATLSITYNRYGHLLESMRKDGTAITYTLEGKLDEVKDASGAVAIDYQYDSDGNLLKIEMAQTREELRASIEASEDEIEKNIVDNQQAVLDELARQEQIAKDALDAQVADARLQIADARAQIKESEYKPRYKEFLIKKAEETLAQGKTYFRINDNAPGFEEIRKEFDVPRHIFYEEDQWRVYQELLYRCAPLQHGTDTNGQKVFFITGTADKFSNAMFYVKKELDDAANLYKQIDDAEAQLNANYNTALGQIASDVQNIKDELAKQRQGALAQFNQEKSSLYGELAIQEALPLIQSCYREMLGRDPGEDELDDWRQRIKTDNITSVTSDMVFSYLEGLDEYRTKQTLKEDIINEVGAFLSDYLNASDEEKVVMAETLGLSDGDLFAVDENSAYDLIAYLNSQSLHFGGSGIDSLIELLASQGISAGRKDLIKHAILIDILTGVLEGDSSEMLMISMFALSKVAEAKGVSLYGVNIDYNELAPDSIAHIHGDHYVLIKEIGESEITYYEPNFGPQGKTVTISKEEFLEDWKGVALSLANNELRALSKPELQSIRGAGWLKNFFKKVGNFFKKVGDFIGDIVQAIIDIPKNIINAIKAGNWGAALLMIGSIVVSAIVPIGPMVQGLLAPIKAMFGSIMHSLAQTTIGNMISTAVGNVVTFATSAWNSVKSFPLFGKIATGLKAIGTKLGLVGEITGNAFTKGLTSTWRSMVDIGISSAIYENVDANPVIRSVLAAGLTGGLRGEGFLTPALTAGTIGAIQELGDEFGFDQTVTDILAIGGGALANGIASGTIEGLPTTIAANVGGELARHGMVKLGDKFGIDPQISQLAGIGLSNSISTSIQNPNATQSEIFASITEGLKRGAVSVSISHAIQESGIDPLVGNIAMSTIMGAIEGGLDGRGVFRGIFDTYKESTLNTFSLGGPGNTSWSHAAYIAKVQDFSEIVAEKGLDVALDTYATSIFHQSTINSILKTSDTIAGYIRGKMEQGEYKNRTTPTGKEGKEIELSKNDGVYLNKEGTDILGLKLGDVYMEGVFGVDEYGRLRLKSGTLIDQLYSDAQSLQRIENGLQAYAEFKTSDGKTIIITPKDSEGYNVYNSYGKYVEAKITDYTHNKEYTIEDLELSTLKLLSEDNSTTLFNLGLSDSATINLLINNLSIAREDIASLDLTAEDRKQITYYVLANGIINPNPNGIAPGYIAGITSQLAFADPEGSDYCVVPLYEQSGGVRGAAEDVWNWIKNTYLGSDDITYDVLFDINYHFNNNPPPDMVGVAFSGGGDPLVQTLNKRPDIDMKSIVFFGAPFKYNRKITNPNVENVIMIGGTLDLIAEQGFTNQNFEGGSHPINTYKIALKGIGHRDYSYDPNNPNPDPIKVKSARFIAEVAECSNNLTKLRDFLTHSEGIIYNATSNIFTVDLEKVTYYE
ncbi:MAG: hypothetical protein HQ593_00030 [Candidatus Omnitrophica bacterium]|nr:hypothetical protein [Candidatus Omnitrophota bacterium]